MSYNKESGMYEGYIYKITNNINDKIYIGQTSVSISIRWSQHIYDSKEKELPLYRAMRKYGLDNFNIIQLETIIKNSEKELENELNDKEIYYISLYNSVSPNGYNMTLGGGNTSERIKTPVDAYYGDGTLYKEYSSTVEGIRDIGYDINVNSISACCKGKQQSCCGFVWRYHGEPFDKYPITQTPERISRYNIICPVDKYSIDGSFIESYKSFTDVLSSIGKTNEFSSPIRLCCMNKQSQAYGYVWRFHGDSFDSRKINTHNDMSPVDVYDLNLKYINSFYSINEAIRQLNLPLNSYSSISSCCKGLSKTCHKYIWRYKGDDLWKYGNPLEKKKKENKKINQYDINDNYIDTFKSALNAGKKYNSTGDPIINCIKRKTNCSLGYKWYYADDPNQPDKSKIIA